MTTAEKLVTVAENQQRVYDAGYEKGKAEGIDYDTFWDSFQGNGQPMVYQVVFAYNRFNKETYNPKYPIICSNSNVSARHIFYNNTEITDTKVPIDVSAISTTTVLQNTFSCYGAGKISALETIRELRVAANTDYPNAFMNCSALKNIVITGTVGKSISFQFSPLLTKESIMSVFNALSTDVTGQTVTFSKRAVDAAFTTEEWEALTATKTNWTYAVA